MKSKASKLNPIPRPEKGNVYYHPPSPKYPEMPAVESATRHMAQLCGINEFDFVAIRVHDPSKFSVMS
jgi:hypothetical protein